MAAAIRVATAMRHGPLRSRHLHAYAKSVLAAALAVEGNSNSVNTSCERMAGVAWLGVAAILWAGDLSRVERNWDERRAAARAVLACVETLTPQAVGDIGVLVCRMRRVWLAQ
ncbi:hypothetical protein D3C73_1332760 [compost metagenome]